MWSLNRDGRLWLLVASIVCLALYWPGLYGGFLFDDFPNLVANPDVIVGKNPRLADWLHAVWSSHTDLKRPLAMLSFAINIYFSGMNPFPMKLVNLVIHLANGWLLYRVALELLAWNTRALGEEGDIGSQRRVAALMTVVWLLLPINVSSVLYVVQRMENLAQLFVLGGLWAYLHLRRPDSTAADRPWQAFLVMMLMMLAGLLSKETAALLPLYTLLTEFTLLRFRTASGTSRGLIALYGLLIILPGLLATTWIIRHDFNAVAYGARNFTPVERLLTESRVVCSYIKWILLPTPNSLSFYHDTYAISHGLLDPPATLACILLITALLGTAVLLRSRLPLLSLGLLWFFAAHLLTATFIPLELVFEHRNYFASIGIVFAAASLTMALQRREERATLAIVVAAVLLFGFLTAMRARDWSDPLQLAHAEVDAHPESPRANYELGRMLVIASGYRSDSPFLAEAFKVLRHNADLPSASILPLSAMILTANRSHSAVDPAWWEMITSHLQQHAPTIEDVTALQDLSRCQLQATDCAQQVDEMMTALRAALAHPGASAILLMTYGDYVADHLGDLPEAEKAIRMALERSPGEIEIQLELIKILMLEGDKEATAPITEQLHKENMTPEQIDKLRRMLLLPKAGSPQNNGVPAQQ